MSCLSTPPSLLSCLTRLPCCFLTTSSTPRSSPFRSQTSCRAYSDPKARVQRTFAPVRRTLATWPITPTTQNAKRWTIFVVPPKIGTITKAGRRGIERRSDRFSATPTTTHVTFKDRQQVPQKTCTRTARPQHNLPRSTDRAQKTSESQWLIHEE